MTQPRPDVDVWEEFRAHIAAALAAATADLNLPPRPPATRRERLAARIGTAGWTVNDVLHRAAAAVCRAGDRLELAGDRLAERIADR